MATLLEEKMEQFIDSLSLEDRTLIVSVLRWKADDGPYPDLCNLKFWRLSYVLKCLRAALEHFAGKPEPTERINNIISLITT